MMIPSLILVLCCLLSLVASFSTTSKFRNALLTRSCPTSPHTSSSLCISNSWSSENLTDGVMNTGLTTTKLQISAKESLKNRNDNANSEMAAAMHLEIQENSQDKEVADASPSKIILSSEMLKEMQKEKAMRALLTTRLQIEAKNRAFRNMSCVGKFRWKMTLWWKGAYKTMISNLSSFRWNMFKTYLKIKKKFTRKVKFHFEISKDLENAWQ